jgi:small subunit ribosomal protein S6
MRHYEVTFIVDPVLSSDEVKATAQKYADMIAHAGYNIVHIDEMGLRQLAYEIKKRHSGLYYCIEFSGENGTIIDKMELTLRRDDKILRFLTVALDKYGVKYNQDKRAGKIGKRKAAEAATKKKKEDDEELEVESAVTADAV